MEDKKLIRVSKDKGCSIALKTVGKVAVKSQLVPSKGDWAGVSLFLTALQLHNHGQPGTHSLLFEQRVFEKSRAQAVF